MTLPANGTSISVSQVAVEIGAAATTQEDINYLNSLILPAEKPPAFNTPYPNMDRFHQMTYYQNNTAGNCNNGNCAAPGGGGNIQCTNCSLATINCTNCDSQAYLQLGVNCACTYNCSQVTNIGYNCNCACNCSKIICAKLHEFGLLNPNVWAADQAYGQWLRKNDRMVYRGYVRWARIVTAWMDGKGPDFMVWIKDKNERITRQKAAITDMAMKIGLPWSEHMAYLMGEFKNDNLMGRVCMTIGKPICRFVDLLPRKPKAQRHKLHTLYAMWALFFFTYYTALSVVKVSNVINKFKTSFKKLVFKEV